MEKIASFQVNHLVLLPGLYVSRKDNINGNIITTFDIRITKPNDEAVMDTGSIHTIEHLGATFLRNVTLLLLSKKVKSAILFTSGAAGQLLLDL